MWQDFDALCDAQNKRTQARLEMEAMKAVKHASTTKSPELRAAIGYAIEQVTLPENWSLLADVLKGNPMGLPPEKDTTFFKKCPKEILKDLVGSGGGILAQLISRVGSGEGGRKFDATDIRLMHITIDSLGALGETERLKKVAKIFSDLSEVHSENGLLPGSVHTKLVRMKLIERSNSALSTTVSCPGKPKSGPAKPRTLDKGPAHVRTPHQDEAARLAGTHKPFADLRLTIQ